MCRLASAGSAVRSCAAISCPGPRDCATHPRPAHPGAGCVDDRPDVLADNGDSAAPSARRTSRTRQAAHSCPLLPPPHRRLLAQLDPIGRRRRPTRADLRRPRPLRPTPRPTSTVCSPPLRRSLTSPWSCFKNCGNAASGFLVFGSSGTARSSVAVRAYPGGMPKGSRPCEAGFTSFRALPSTLLLGGMPRSSQRSSSAPAGDVPRWAVRINEAGAPRPESPCRRSGLFQRGAFQRSPPPSFGVEGQSPPAARAGTLPRDYLLT